MSNQVDDAQDLVKLGQLAFFCFAAVEPVLLNIPKTREAQGQLAETLANALSNTTSDFTITKQFLVETVRLKDRSLLDNWASTPRQLAWLMVHEELSEYFTRYAMRRWNPQVYIIHHVPKTAGTSVNQLLHKQGLFIAYPQTGFKEMCRTYGVLGFARQMKMFRNAFDNTRLYIGGHYNLHARVMSLGLYGKCRGTSLCREPYDLLSSAVRYVWTKIENGDEDSKKLYDATDLEPSALAALRQNAEATKEYSRPFAEIISRLMDNKQFRSEYDEIYVKYFYGEGANSPSTLRSWLEGCGNLFYSFDAQASQRQLLASLGAEGTLPHANRSLLSEDVFQSALGGADAFKSTVAPRLKESSEIYNMLLELSGASAATGSG